MVEWRVNGQDERRTAMEQIRNPKFPAETNETKCLPPNAPLAHFKNYG